MGCEACNPTPEPNALDSQFGLPIPHQQQLVHLACNLGSADTDNPLLCYCFPPVEKRLHALHIPFILLRGDPIANIPALVGASGSRLLVTDYSPLRVGRWWRGEVAKRVTVPGVEVDAHNIVPVWTGSDRIEEGAWTIRPKLLPKVSVLATQQQHPFSLAYPGACARAYTHAHTHSHTRMSKLLSGFLL